MLKLKTGANFTTKKLIRILARNCVTKTQDALNTFIKGSGIVICHIIITMTNCTLAFIDLEGIAYGPAMQKVSESCLLLQ